MCHLGNFTFDLTACKVTTFKNTRSLDYTKVPTCVYAGSLWIKNQLQITDVETQFLKFLKSKDSDLMVRTAVMLLNLQTILTLEMKTQVNW